MAKATTVPKQNVNSSTMEKSTIVTMPKEQPTNATSFEHTSTTIPSTTAPHEIISSDNIIPEENVSNKFSTALPSDVVASETEEQSSKNIPKIDSEKEIDTPTVQEQSQLENGHKSSSDSSANSSFRISKSNDPSIRAVRSKNGDKTFHVSTSDEEKSSTFKDKSISNEVNKLSSEQVSKQDNRPLSAESVFSIGENTDM